jgi:hypothetical protein
MAALSQRNPASTRELEQSEAPLRNEASQTVGKNKLYMPGKATTQRYDKVDIQ